MAEELRAGVRPRDERRLEREVLVPFVRRGRVFAPAFAGWTETGDAIRRVAAIRGPPMPQTSKSLVGDVHLALACRAHGVRLVTGDVSDLTRIAALVVGFAFGPLWPTS